MAKPQRTACMLADLFVTTKEVIFSQNNLQAYISNSDVQTKVVQDQHYIKEIRMQTKSSQAHCQAAATSDRCNQLHTEKKLKSIKLH